MFSGKKLKELEDQLTLTQNELSNVKQQLAQKEQQLSTTAADLQQTKESLQSCTTQNAELNVKYQAINDIQKEVDARRHEMTAIDLQIADLNTRYQNALSVHSGLESELALYQDQLEINSFGLYTPQFNFDTAEQFKVAIEANYEEQKQLIKEEKAIVCHTEWTVGGSKAEGKKMTNQYKKLMLFAFNGECDGLIAKVKWNNAEKSKDRIVKSFESINKLGATQSIEITTDYVGLKLKELSLTYEYEQKKYDEKEEQRRIREQMKEEEKAQREFERAQREAEDEEFHYEKALDKAKADMAKADNAGLEVLQDKVRLLEQQLAEAHAKKERAIAMAQLTKAGHIYIISNIGSFGEDVYKMGMTRRLDPLDRVRELGDASVPFLFDVHAVIYSDNAPQLEYELHQKFSERRINRINNRKEFFRVSLDEIQDFVNRHTGAEIAFTKIAEARDYRETLTMLDKLSVQEEAIGQPAKFPASLV
jgi:Domain of unknown function (DUF4041)/T5orf172 domain